MSAIDCNNVSLSVRSGYNEFKPLCLDPDISAEEFSVYAFAFVYNHFCVNFGVISPESAEFVEFTSLVSQGLARLLKGASSESIQEAILQKDWR